MKAHTLGIVVAAFLGGSALAGFVAASMPAGGARPDAGWTEVRWPFPMDQWGEGRAFHCGQVACGDEIDLIVRAKVGFCNCTTGVNDDDELDRVSDFDLMGRDVKPAGPGRAVPAEKGAARERLFAVSGTPVDGAKTALSFAFNSGCDAVVVTALTGANPSPGFASTALRFAHDEAMRRTVAALLPQ